MPKILIVDDEDPIRMLVRDILERSKDGYEIVEATSGQQALELLPEVRPDLLVMDIVMPGVSGLMVCEQVRQDPILGQIKILLVSGKGGDDVVAAGLAAGANDFVLKPFSPMDLLARVRKVLSQPVLASA